MSIRNPIVTLVLVPRVDWESREIDAVTLGRLAEQAIGEETRLAKRPDQATTGRRYASLCTRIETYAALLQTESSFMFPLPGEMGSDYFRELLALSRIGESLPERWSASFHPPGPATREIAKYFLNADSPALQWKGRALALAFDRECGVVEIGLNPLSRTPPADSVLTSSGAVLGRPGSLQMEPTPKRGSSFEGLREQLMRAKTSQVPINISNFRHRDITETLHGFVYSKDERGDLRFCFTDRTEAVPFRLPGWCAQREVAPPLRTLSVALISMRHPSLDDQVAFALMRNNEISRIRTGAQQEAFAFGSAVSFLSAHALDPGGRIDLYQTGLEPAVIGFYRAAVTALQNRVRKGLPPLTILPVYFRRARTRVASGREHIQKLCKSKSELLRLVSGKGGGTADQTLHWIPERPMNLTELKTFVDEFPDCGSQLEAIYADSQYEAGTPWVAPEGV